MSVILWLLLASQLGLISPHGEKAVVLVFVRSDCPVSNRYAPELQRLYERFSSQGIDLHLVYPESGLTLAAVEKHQSEFSSTIPAVLDADHQYVTRAGARTTPEAAVFVQGRLIYSGRIDDRYLDIGKARPEAVHRDLEEVLAAVAAGKNLKRRSTRAVGCAIETLR